MTKSWTRFLFLLAVAPLLCAAKKHDKVVLVIHGGLGWEKKNLTPEKEVQFRDALMAALKLGYIEYRANKPAIEVVQAAIVPMEDSPLFNAGKGSVFTRDGRNELDASMMEGKDKKAGAVAGVTTIKNPIKAARAVMERSKHVMLISKGAEAFAEETGLEIVSPSYFRTEERWKEHQEELEAEKKAGRLSLNVKPKSWGTVGAVALDHDGNLAAGTSTGGMSMKRWGRVGDSPIIGAGTYADNEGAAVSSTGHGEFFIRYGVANDINALVKYKKLSVQKAADEVINGKLKKVGGEGGVIALDRKGNLGISFNSEGLYRAYITENGEAKVFLYEN